MQDSATRELRHQEANSYYFSNDDTEVITEGWIEELLMLAQLPEVAVGPKLLYPDGSIQHAGIFLSDKNIAQHAGVLLPENHNLYCNVLNTLHECAAVTGACLMIEKKKFVDLGMFDELWTPNGYGDIEFGIRVRKTAFVTYSLHMQHFITMNLHLEELR